MVRESVMAENLEIHCPCCESLIVVDRGSGEILYHKVRERGPGASIEEMVAKMEAQKSEMAKKFDQGLESQKDRGRILDARFREAMERAEKGGKPPINPMDLD